MEFQSQRFVFDEPSTPLGRIKLCAISNSEWSISPSAMRTIDYYIISYVIEGTGVFGDESGFQQAIGPGDLICFFPGVAHFYAPTGAGYWTRFYIHFEGPVFDLWRNQSVFDPRHPVVHLEPVTYWLERLRGVISTQGMLGQGRSLIEVARLQEILAEAFRIRQATHELPGDRMWLERVCRSIDAALSPNISLSDVARKNGMSYASFRNRFTNLAGISPGRYRTSRLMAKACNLVVNTDMTSKEIAEQLGFADEFHFSRRFKQCTEHSPREFRRLYYHSGPHDLRMSRFARGGQPER